MSYKYQNVTDVEQVLMGHGLAAPGAEIITETEIENPNFKFIGEVNNAPAEGKITGIAESQPNAVTEAEKVELPEGDIK